MRQRAVAIHATLPRHHLLPILATAGCRTQHTAHSRSRARMSTQPTGGEEAQGGGFGGGRGHTHFGFENVRVEEKVDRVGEVFHKVADSYDLMNDLMSVGVHRLWKQSFISKLNPQPGSVLLDVAGGTGDIAFGCVQHMRSLSLPTAISLPDRPPHPGKVVVSDINPSMLGVGRERAIQRGLAITDEDGLPPSSAAMPPLQFVEANAEVLPFESNTFDAYTIAFGLRNVTRPELALAEALRVLKRGGRFMCLEFSQCENFAVQQLYDSYSFNIIPEIGRLVANDRDSYQYLVESIRKFPPQEELAAMMRDAGMGCVSYENWSGGVVAVHSGFKL